MDDDSVQLYDNQPIRTAWDEELEEWYFSIIDVVAVLTESKDANAYWRKLKQRLIQEGNETVTNCHALKKRMTDVANTEQLLQIIQSIPSKKAEPFKLWLAQVGRDRIEERKSSWQYEYIGTCTQYVSRSNDNGTYKGAESIWIRRK